MNHWKIMFQYLFQDKHRPLLIKLWEQCSFKTISASFVKAIFTYFCYALPDTSIQRLVVLSMNHVAVLEEVFEYMLQLVTSSFADAAPTQQQQQLIQQALHFPLQAYETWMDVMASFATVPQVAQEVPSKSIDTFLSKVQSGTQDKKQSVDLNALRKNNKRKQNKIINKDLVIDLFGAILNEGNVKVFSKILADRFDFHHSVPTNDQYTLLLPKKSMFECDLLVDKLFNKFPILLDLLLMVPASEVINFYDTVHSLLVNCIGEWNSVSSTPKHILAQRTQFIMELVNKGQFVAEPLCFVSEIVPSLQANEVTLVLMQVWKFMQDYKPQHAEYSASQGRTIPAAAISNVKNYLQPVKDALRNHVEQLAPFYARFVK